MPCVRWPASCASRACSACVFLSALSSRRQGAYVAAMPSKMISIALVSSVLVGVVAGAGPAVARDGSYGPSGTFVVDPEGVSSDLDDAGFRCPKVVKLPKTPTRVVALKNADTVLKSLA